MKSTMTNGKMSANKTRKAPLVTYAKVKLVKDNGIGAPERVEIKGKNGGSYTIWMFEDGAIHIDGFQTIGDECSMLEHYTTPREDSHICGKVGEDAFKVATISPEAMLGANLEG